MAAVPPLRLPSQVFTPEQFGASGDGQSDDTEAFGRMSTAVAAAGGGTIRLSAKVYMVGRQSRSRPPEYLFEPDPVIDLENLPLGVTIAGNGAVLRARPGLRYGSFSASGERLTPRLPFYDGAVLATPYRFMIRISNSYGPVAVENLELDGNIAAMRLGGEWGDTGRQIPMTGIGLFDNRDTELVSNVHSHHHGQDGLILDGLTRTNRFSRIENVVCEDNGRQGCSLVGGAHYRFADCAFRRTGRGPVLSAPAAGVDIEAENGKAVHAITFERCIFEDCAGAGMVADSGPSSDITFSECRFVGTTNFAAWPSKPKMRFENCVFVGAITRAFASRQPALATRFVRCTFLDYDLPNRRPVYGSDGAVPMVDLGGSYESGLNTVFDRCTFDLRRGGVLPWTTGAIFISVKMRQASSAPSYPRGRYLGVSEIHGPAVLSYTTIEGTLTLNGKPVR